MPERLYLSIMFLLKQRRRLNWASPESLNEKIQLWKLKSNTEFYKRIADKYTVREYVRGLIGEQYLIPLIHFTRKPEEKDFAMLPNSFVMKSNHGSFQVKIIKNLEEENVSDLLASCKNWLSVGHTMLTKEYQYEDIERGVLFEEVLLDCDGKIPNDFKFHCFNGKVEFIQVDIDRFDGHCRNFYDANWLSLPFTWSPWKGGSELYPRGRDVPKPELLNEMIEIASKLSSEFSYVRVDLYFFDRKIYFGELTLHHESGWARFNPQKYDTMLGKMVN